MWLDLPDSAKKLQANKVLLESSDFSEDQNPQDGQGASNEAGQVDSSDEDNNGGGDEDAPVQSGGAGSASNSAVPSGSVEQEVPGSAHSQESRILANVTRCAHLLMNASCHICKQD